MHSQGRIVAEVTDEVMDGDTPLEKKMNALLTRTFILSRDVPADECLSEAKEVIKRISQGTSVLDLAKYLQGRFGFEDDELYSYIDKAEKAIELHKAG
jgi:hypothetical protein